VRTILKLLLSLAGLHCLCPAPVLAQSGPADLLNHYEEARDYCVLLINELRAEHNLPGVRLEPLACELALQHARDMAEQDYFSHWNEAGDKPTRRYNELGGMHGLGENIFFSEYQAGDWRAFIDEAMQTLRDSPGHLKTMLEPGYTDVGIGMAVRGARFYLSQEFICRVGGEYRCPLDAAVGNVIKFSGRIDPQRFALNYVVLRHEGLPEPRERKWLNGTSEYREGDTMFAVYTADLNRQYRDVETFYNLKLDGQGRFSCELLLDYKGKPGTYYVMLILHDLRSGREVQAAGIAVEVLR
jgi:hypothetical protein